MKISPVVQHPQAADRRNPAKPQNLPHRQNPKVPHSLPACVRASPGLFPLAETIFDCTAPPFNKTRYATLYLEKTVASGEDRPTHQRVAKRIDSCVLTRMVASTTL